MKRLFSLLVLTIVAAISVDASAQSIVGKWNSSADAQAKMLESMGGTINEQTATVTYNSDNTYCSYSYVDATADVMGYEMHMVMELSETGTWSLDGNEITMTNKSFDIGKFDVTFSDPVLNAAGEQVKAAFTEALTSGEGIVVVYDIKFIDNDTAELNLDNELMPMNYTITRIK